MYINLSRIAVMLVLLGCGHYACAMVAGEQVSQAGTVDDDLYMAGGQVDLYATVNGDVVVAGGQLNLEGHVRADVTAAGGEIELRGIVGDDARLAGGNVRVLADIGDDLVAAGGRLQLGPTAQVAGSVWLTGGDVQVGGSIGESLHVSGGRVILAGTVGGDVEVRAEKIEVRAGADIAGSLHYQSPNAAVIEDGARIGGDISHTPVELPVAPVVAGVLFVSLVALLGLMLTGIVLYLAFPGVAQRCSDTIRESHWSSLGYGLAVFAGGPFVFVLLLSTGIGIFLGLLLLAIWLAMLLAGYLAGAYYVADAGLRKLNKDEAGRAGRSVALASVLLLLAVVGLVPLLGRLVNWLVLLAGIGALKRQAVSAYVREQVAAESGSADRSVGSG